MLVCVLKSNIGTLGYSNQALNVIKVGVCLMFRPACVCACVSECLFVCLNQNIGTLGCSNQAPNACVCVFLIKICKKKTNRVVVM